MVSLIGTSKVENINGIPNQFIIRDIRGGETFQSYKSTIAYKDVDGIVYLDKVFWNYSRTTGKYRNIFLNETRKETEQKILMGEYSLIHLNWIIITH